jgi:hypothetical protein
MSDSITGLVEDYIAGKDDMGPAKSAWEPLRPIWRSTCEGELGKVRKAIAAGKDVNPGSNMAQAS